AAEIAAQVISAEQSPVGEHRAERGSLLAQYAAQYWQSVQRKEAIKVAPIARRRTNILALTATLGLVLIVAGGTLGYRWTQPYIEEEVSAPSQQDRVPLPTTSPRSLSTRPVPSEQHVVRIASRRSEADVLAGFRRLQQERPTLFGQAILKRIDPPPFVKRIDPSLLWQPETQASNRVQVRPRPGLQSYTAQVGPFASEKDAAAACQALAAADIQ